MTGAAKGMGRAIALRLANDGYDVSINDIPSAETKLQEVGSLISKAGRRAFLCTADMSVEDDVKRLVESTAENLGSVDVVRYILYHVRLLSTESLTSGCLIVNR